MGGHQRALGCSIHPHVGDPHLLLAARYLCQFRAGDLRPPARTSHFAAGLMVAIGWRGVRVPRGPGRHGQARQVD